MKFKITNEEELQEAKEQALSIIVSHLKAQGCKSMYPGTDTCMYRGANNTKCAIGSLISDEDYTEDMEGLGCGNVLVAKLLIENYNRDDTLLKNMMIFLNGCQEYLHDGLEEEHFTNGQLEKNVDIVKNKYWNNV